MTSAFDRDLVRRSVHEVGHALMAHLVGARVKRVSINEVGELIGYCSHSSVASPGARALITAGGIAAELEFYGAYQLPTARLDFESLRDYAKGEERRVVSVIDTARSGLGDRRTRGVLALLADELAREGELPGSLLHAVAGLHGVEVVWTPNQVRPEAEASGPGLVSERSQKIALRGWRLDGLGGGFAPIMA